MYAKNCEDVNKCQDEFDSIFSWTVLDNAPVKILSKHEQKLKAKPSTTLSITISVNFQNFMFKFSIKDMTKKLFFSKVIEIY